MPPKKTSLSRKRNTPTKAKPAPKGIEMGAKKKSRLASKTKAATLRMRNATKASIGDRAKEFFVACEAGSGWQACSAYCTPDATFSAQAEPLADTKTLREYTEWMKGLMATLTDGRYELRSFATDLERNNVCAYGVFTGTHLANGPCPPTGKSANTDYVYVMQFDDDKIVHMTKIWHSGLALKQLGWA
jgi:SnoaL-like domain